MLCNNWFWFEFKLRKIYQSQITECRLACIAMEASAYGQTLSLADLRQRKQNFCKLLEIYVHEKKIFFNCNSVDNYFCDLAIYAILVIICSFIYRIGWFNGCHVLVNLANSKVKWKSSSNPKSPNAVWVASPWWPRYMVRFLVWPICASAFPNRSKVPTSSKCWQHGKKWRFCDRYGHIWGVADWRWKWWTPEIKE